MCMLCTRHELLSSRFKTLTSDLRRSQDKWRANYLFYACHNLTPMSDDKKELIICLPTYHKPQYVKIDQQYRPINYSILWLLSFKPKVALTMDEQHAIQIDTFIVLKVLTWLVCVKTPNR
jgi:hypothetical protein